MKIYLGRRELEFSEGVTLERVIGQNEIKKINGIWVNGILVPLIEFHTFVLHDGDRIKIQRIICGG